MSNDSSGVDERAAQARFLARELTARTGVTVTVVWRGSADAEYGKWDVCWSGESPNVTGMAAHVAEVTAHDPDMARRVRYAWRAPSRRPH